MRKIKLILLIIGTIIGAGFVSGKEIAVFFSNFGYYSLIFVVPMFFLLYFVINKLLNIGTTKRITNANELNEIIFKKNNKIIKIFTFISFIILSSTMFSAIPSCLGYNTFCWQKVIITLIVCFIMCFVISKNISFIQTLCLFIVPTILLLMIIVCTLKVDAPSNVVINKNIVLVPYNALNYVCRNMFLSYYVISSSSYKFSQKECKRVAFFSSIILCLVMTLVILTELCNPNCLTQTMPMLFLAKNWRMLYILYLGILLFAIATTLISSLVTLKTLFNFKHKFLNSFFAVAICATFSMIRFDYFVEYLYPVIGMLGAYLILALFFPNFFLQYSNKKIHTTSQQTKN